ncbi:hypothetical protein MKW98_020033 [Papaver atlanticum]|uniref:Uncharacterized protein n=1 Tax=Papaver atlanticum TaxID=357466 RepID=A0AAD4S133_9MAGN|nr:hypothetical protein MKW98_020033 [Papaver atlanticum]
METNNGKSSGSPFVEEQNACGVPQQFVDAKEKKIRKKKHRITLDIQKKMNIEQEKGKEMELFGEGKYEETMRLIDLMEKRVVMEESILEGHSKNEDGCLSLLSILQGRNVVIEKSFGAAKVIKDSVIVAESIEFKDKVIDIVAILVKQEVNATNNVAGDGDQQELVFSSTSAEANAAVAAPHVTGDSNIRDSSERPGTRSQFMIVKLRRPKASMLTNAAFTLQRKALFSRAWLLLKVCHHMICPNIKCQE